LAPLNLEGLASFFRYGSMLQAIEILRDGSFYLYGKKEAPPTLAGMPMTLSDLAVAYRAVFWPGYSEPYISLDKHEDNRFAKVNFGGLLKDTRIGQVVLDADRYFKTISTGLDPFDRKDITEKIRVAVPGYLSGATLELADDVSGQAEFRFWFYPDSLQVVTNGNIGVVTSPRFFADVERQDNPAQMSAAQRNSIDDLNRRYNQYRLAVPTYNELDNVGRLLALMYWLKEIGADQQIDLASLLSVELPSWRTDRHIRKMLAVSSYHGPEAQLDANAPGFLKRTRVFDFSNRLDERSPYDTDEDLLVFGNHCFDDLPKTAYTTDAEHVEYADLEREKAVIDRAEADLDRLDKELEASRNKLDRFSQASIDAFNRKIDNFNTQQSELQNRIGRFNDRIDAQEAKGIVILTNISIGGGIDLAIRSRRIGRRAPHAEPILALAAAKPHFKNLGGVQVSGEWIRSMP
jgi:hypothetical protein